MAKGSKKYASHEYDMVKGGPALKAHKEKALELRKDSKTYPRKMADGGTPNPNNPSSMGVPAGVLGALSSAASNPQGAVHKAKGGEVKKKEDNRKDIGDDNKAGSIYELGSSYKKGGEVKAENKEQKAKVKGDSEKNDNIPALLSEDEFVLKRSIMKSKDAPKKAAEAVKKAKDKKKK